MGARRVAAGAWFALVAAHALAWPNSAASTLTVLSSFQATSQTSQSGSPDASQAGTSSTETVHRKTGANSSETIRHTRVVEEDAVTQQVTQAESSIQKKDYSTAETLLQKAVASDPANYAAWFDLGFTENVLGKTDESIAAYRKSVAAKPDVFESNLNLGIQLAKTGQPDAEGYLRAATALTPTSHVNEGRARAWLSLAHVLETNKPEEAIAAYRQAAILQPKDPEPRLAAGILYEKLQRFSEAMIEYQHALALDPSSDALTGLANLYMRGRKFPEAEEYLKKVVAQQPASAQAHIQLGRVLAAENKNDDAVAELEQGAKLAPSDVSVKRDLADLYSTLGKNDQAEATYRTLIAGSPKDAELHDNLGRALLHEKKTPDAVKEFLAAVTLKPGFGEAYSDLAFAASENKDYSLTIKALDARAKLLPETPPTHFLRASAYDHLKDVKKAVASYRLFLDSANGKYPDEEWQAKHRLIALEPKR